MDSQFVNFDGRSVHDVLKLLLAASGDPEAIERLLQEIQTVNAKFGPVNTELARLEEDKQDAGNYITDNVEGTVANISKAMIANVESGYDIQINNTGTGNVDVDWLRFIFKGSADKQIAATIRRNGKWETAARWTADEDTGWIDAEKPSGSSGTVQYRKKDGRVIIYINSYTPPSDYNGTSGGGSDIFTLPAGFRPDKNIFFTLVEGSWEHKFTVCIRGNTGLVQVKSNTGNVIPKATPCYGTIEFTPIV